MRLSKLTSVLLAAGLLSVPVLAVSPTQQKQNRLASSDAAIVRQAITDGNMQVELAHLALQRAHSEAVIQFAELALEEHNTFNAELRTILRTRGLPAPSATLDEHGQRIRGHLASLTGDAFDAAYMQHMRDEHRKAAVFLSHASSGARDPVLRAQSAKALGLVQERQKLIENIAPVKSATDGK